MAWEPDYIDKKIITLLQENARMPVKAIAEQVFLTSPSVSARIERMEEEGMIQGYQVIINPEILGYHIKAFIEVQVMPKQRKTFYPFIASFPNVLSCSSISGDYEMMLEMVFKRSEDLDDFIGNLQDFGKTRTQIVFSSPIEHRGVRPLNENETI